MIALLAAAWACDVQHAAPPDTQAVVWLSPMGKTVGAGTRLRVVPVRALRDAAGKDGLSVGRALQIAGERKKARAPRRPWKATVFQASSGALCRPIEGEPESAFVDGLPVCGKRESRADRQQTTCGTTVDRASERPGVELYRAAWRDLAPQGFCVLPLDRFLAEL
ncbi:MAG: hypothetical protein KC656_11225 [Myxococcales bacterium]|nr:hypothetical protein [Myxococcales bacterium]